MKMKDIMRLLKFKEDFLFFCIRGLFCFVILQKKNQIIHKRER